MTLPDFAALLSPAGQSALRAAAALEPDEERFLPLFTQLQKQFPASIARAALETATLRVRARARGKFTRADSMYFTREGLEQASGEAISTYRAGRYVGFRRVADLACGLGGDTLSLAAVAETVGVDADPLRLALAAENLRAYGRSAGLLQADLVREPPPEAGAAFFDPGRRAGGRRLHSIREYQPPLALVEAWLPRIPALGAKISPGVDKREIAGYDAELEFISVGGELKEAVLWWGPLRTGAATRATLLPGGHSMALAPGERVELPLLDPQAYLYEPDPAVIRAGLVEKLGAALGAGKLDDDIAYLTAAALTPTPFARAYAIEEAMPFQLKRLRARLRALGVGQAVIKKRGSPLEPATLLRRLRLEGAESRVVFLTHVRGRAYALIGRAIEPQG
ncbi:MAG: SAM-dependent methyltransferase [Chloroflexi bacterium]|nr:SAM-dependent methyltransferase [Chloroflexota bacterium]